MRKFVFSTSRVNTSPAPAIFTLSSYLPLHVCDVPVPANLLFHVRKMSPPTSLSANVTNIFTSHAFIKKFPHFLLQLMIAPRKSVFLTIIMSTKVPFCKRLLALVNLLLHVILNFQSTRMILAFNIFSVFNLMALIYMKCYSNLSRRLTSYINQHNFVIMVFQLLLSLSSL